MASALIVDFPLRRNHDVVRFAETVQLYTVDRHQDKNELWYVNAEYSSMKCNIKRDVLQARARDSPSDKDSGFWIGISHLLAPACMLEVQACRRPCSQASETGLMWKFQIGKYCICFVSGNKKGRIES